MKATDAKRENRKWVAPSTGGYAARSASGRIIPRPTKPPQNPAPVSGGRPIRREG